MSGVSKATLYLRLLSYNLQSQTLCLLKSGILLPELGWIILKLWSLPLSVKYKPSGKWFNTFSAMLTVDYTSEFLQSSVYRYVKKLIEVIRNFFFKNLKEFISRSKKIMKLFFVCLNVAIFFISCYNCEVKHDLLLVCLFIYLFVFKISLA